MRKKIVIIIFVVCVVLLGFIGVIYAYQTDGDQADNEFTVGNVFIDLDEPGWEPQEDVNPNHEAVKDPYISNTGENDAYVFITVTVPYYDMVTVDESGTALDPEEQALFQFWGNTKEPPKKGEIWDFDEIQKAVNDGWTLLKENVEDDTIIYLFAYTGDSSDSMQVLKGTVSNNGGLGDKTPTLFDNVRTVSFIEDEQNVTEIQLTYQSIDIKAYAIQTENMKTDPEEVWEIIYNQESGLTGGE